MRPQQESSCILNSCFNWRKHTMLYLLFLLFMLLPFSFLHPKIQCCKSNLKAFAQFGVIWNCVTSFVCSWTNRSDVDEFYWWGLIFCSGRANFCSFQLRMWNTTVRAAMYKYVISHFSVDHLVQKVLRNVGYLAPNPKLTYFNCIYHIDWKNKQMFASEDFLIWINSCLSSW